MMSHKELEPIVVSSLARVFGDRVDLRKTHPDVYEGSGIPDFEGHIGGFSLGLELKVSPGLRPAQHVRLYETWRKGGLACVLALTSETECWWKFDWTNCSPYKQEKLSYDRRKWGDHWQYRSHLATHLIKGNRVTILDVEPMIMTLGTHVAARVRDMRALIQSLNNAGA